MPTILVQHNGKYIAEVSVPTDTDKDRVIVTVLADQLVAAYLVKHTITDYRCVLVPNRILNLVTSQTQASAETCHAPDTDMVRLRRMSAVLRAYADPGFVLNTCSDSGLPEILQFVANLIDRLPEDIRLKLASSTETCQRCSDKLKE